MTVQTLGDKLQNIAHSGKSLSNVYVLIDGKYKEINDVQIIQNGNGYIINLEVEK